MKALFTVNGMVDGANLVTVVKLTCEDPFRSVSIKWQLTARPLETRAFVRFRDSAH